MQLLAAERRLDAGPVEGLEEGGEVADRLDLADRPVRGQEQAGTAQPRQAFAAQLVQLPPGLAAAAHAGFPHRLLT